MIAQPRNLEDKAKAALSAENSATGTKKIYESGIDVARVGEREKSASFAYLVRIDAIPSRVDSTPDQERHLFMQGIWSVECDEIRLGIIIYA